MACDDSELIRPRVVESTSVYAARGTTIHEFIKQILSGIPRDEALANISDQESGREACEAIEVASLPRGGHLEIALAWNWRTGVGRVLGHDIGREYAKHGATEDDYVGSFDFAGKRHDGTGVLVDYKTGWSTVSARDSWQLKIGAVMLADTEGLDEVHTAHLHLRDGEPPRWEHAEQDALALSSVRQKLKAYARWREKTTEPVGRVVEGTHCKYCPAFRSCPAKTGLARSMLPALEGEAAAPITLERARDVILLLERVDAISKKVWEEIEGLALHEEIPIGDGRVMRLADGREADKVVKPVEAIALLRKAFGDKHADSAISTTKAAIERSAAAWAKENGSGAPKAKEEVIDRLSVLGIIVKQRSKPSVKIVDEQKR